MIIYDTEMKCERRGSLPQVRSMITALDAAGIEIIDEGAVSYSQGRGVRLRAGSASIERTLADRSEYKPGGRARTRS